MPLFCCVCVFPVTHISSCSIILFVLALSKESSRIYKRLNYYKSLYDSMVTSTLLYREPWINQSMEAVGGYN